ncbi:MULTISPECIES: hypothetical protein [Acetobacter]|uniref:hypothetical protein n=1 Tax=Acetobacter TaxID=434 RepID=UPI0011220543|nr:MULTISPECIES: hypothetical protein [Acetobacter]
MKKKIFTCLAVFMIPSVAHANPQIFGFLPEKCSSVNSLDFSPTSQVGENIIGYFSGLNMATVVATGGKSDDSKFDKIQSVDFITSSVHELCLSKPDMPLSTAIILFWSSRIKGSK